MSSGICCESHRFVLPTCVTATTRELTNTMQGQINLAPIFISRVVDSQPVMGLCTTCFILLQIMHIHQITFFMQLSYECQVI